MPVFLNILCTAYFRYNEQSTSSLSLDVSEPLDMQWQLRVCKAMSIRSSILTGRHIFIYFAFISATYCKMCSVVLVVLTMVLCLEQWIYSQNYNTGRCNLRIYLSKYSCLERVRSHPLFQVFSLINKNRLPLYSLFCLHKRKYSGIKSLVLHKAKCVLRQKECDYWCFLFL